MELAIIRDRPPQQIRRVTRQPRLVTAVNNAGPATLTLHQQREAIKRRDSGEPIRDIARSYNVHNSTISRLIP